MNKQAFLNLMPILLFEELFFVRAWYIIVNLSLTVKSGEIHGQTDAAKISRLDSVISEKKPDSYVSF